MDVPSYLNLNIPYIYSTLCWKVYLTFCLCCSRLFRLCGLYRLAQTPFLWTASSFSQLSCCICWGGARSVGGSWGISCPRWWSHSASPLLDFHFGHRSASGKRRKGSDLRLSHVQVAVMPPSVQRKFERIDPVPHNPEVPCVVRSRQSLLQRPPLYWTARTTVGWTSYLVWMRKNQVFGYILLRKGIGPPSGLGQYFQSTDRG